MTIFEITHSTTSTLLIFLGDVQSGSTIKAGLDGYLVYEISNTRESLICDSAATYINDI